MDVFGIEDSLDLMKYKLGHLKELVCEQGGRLLLTGRVSTIEQGRETIRQTFQNGSALEKFRQMIIGHGVPANIAKQLTSNDDTIVRSILKLGDVSHKAISSQTGLSNPSIRSTTE